MTPLLNHLTVLLEREGHALAPAFRERLTRLVVGYYGTQRFFARLVEPHHRVADVGCGFGQWSVPLLERALHVDFIDTQPSVMEYLTRVLPAQAPATLRRHDCARVPLPDSLPRYDVVLCMGTLFYIHRSVIRAFCTRLVDALAPGGYLFVDTPDPLKRVVYEEFVLGVPAFVRGLYRREMRIVGVHRPPIGGMVRASCGYAVQRARGTVVDSLRRVGATALEDRLVRMFRLRSPDRIGDVTIGEFERLFASLGLECCPHDAVLDPALYLALRDLEGFNLRSTFVGNYYWRALYRKPL